MLRSFVGRWASRGMIGLLALGAVFCLALRPPMAADGAPPSRAAEDNGQPADAAAEMMPNLPLVRIDDAKIAAAGIRKLSSRRLVLYTDLPLSEEVRRLPEVFDQAFPQWCDYFHIRAADHADWRMTGCIIKDKARFESTGLLPADLPHFVHGYSRNDWLWLYEQPSDYYRRHLLLHEGTHGFMNTLLGGCGPPWYMEGMAELLATHRLKDGRLTLNWIPEGRDEVPEWGRIRIVKDEMAAGRMMWPADIVGYVPVAYLKNEPYAWCWALTALLDHDPRYRDRFRQLYQAIPQGAVTPRFYRLFQPDWRELNEQWQVYLAGLEYNDDIPRTAIDFTPGRPLGPAGAVVKVAADRGWQNSGLQLQAATRYRLTASGRYQVGRTTQSWLSEAGGVSIHYYQGRPLGILLAAVRPEDPGDKEPCCFLQPTLVGLGAVLKPARTGTLYLKVNLSAGELGAAAGGLKVAVKERD
ncbi:MAG: hypothetical protein ACLQLG_12965 [Thermoguttaceae bacterium]